MPIIDPMISGECQSLLLNFEELLVQEFGDKHSIVENLFIPLQFTEQRKTLPKSKQDEKIIDFIKTFRNLFLPILRVRFSKLFLFLS